MSSTVETLIRSAKSIVAKAESEGRRLTPTELKAVNETVELIEQHTAGQRTRDELGASSTEEIAKQLAFAGSGKPTFGQPLGAFTGKSLYDASMRAGLVDEAEPGQIKMVQVGNAKDLVVGPTPGSGDDPSFNDPDALSIRRPGIEGLPFVERYLYPVFGTAPIDPGTSKIEYLAQTGRSLDADTMEFASQDTKPTTDSQVELKYDDAMMIATMSGYIPNALLSRADLRGIVDQDCQRALREETESYVVGALNPDTADPGADLVECILFAQQQVIDNGFSPNVTVVSPSDALSLKTVKDDEGRYQSGLLPQLGTLRISDSVMNGSPMAVDASALGTLHIGSLQVAVDGFSKFDQNLTRLRFEYPILMQVRHDDAAATSTVAGS